MKKMLLLASFILSTFVLLTPAHAQRALGGNSLALDNGTGLIIKIVPPPNLLESYTWYLPPKAPPLNTAFTEGGSLTGQTVRWDHALGYWVPTSALFISGNNVGNNVGIGTVTPNQLLEVWGVSGTPNTRFGSLSGTNGWSTNADVSDGYVMADGNGDLIKRNPFTITNQFAWAIGGNTNPTSSVLGTLTNNPLDIQTVGTSRMQFSNNGNILMGNSFVAATLTLEPGSGGTLTINNIPNDDATVNFLTVDASNRVRYRTFSSILGVNANEGLVYDSPNIKLGATNGTINPFVTNRFVNLNNNTLTFSTAGGATSLLTLRGSDGNVGIGTASPNTFKLEVAGSVGPTVNNTYTLGTATKRYKDLYLGPSSLFIGNGAADQTKQSYSVASSVSRLSFDMDDNGANDIWMEETGLLHTNGDVDATGHLTFGGDLKPDGNSGTSGQYLKSNGSGTTPTWTSITQSAWGISGNSNVDSAANFMGSTNNHDVIFRTNNIPRAKFMGSTFSDDSGAFIPWRDNSYQLGTPTRRWRDVYVGPGSIKIGGFISGAKGSQSQQAVDEVTLSYANGNLVIDKPVANFGSMVPNTNNVLALGSSTNRWADLWLGPNSLHIGSPTYEGTISYDPTAKELKFNSNNTIGTSEMKIDSLGNVTILALGAGGLLKANVGGQLALASGGADFEAPLTFNNGLTRTVNTVKLGGALTAATDVPLGTYNLTFSGTGGGRVGIGTTGVPTALLSVGAASPFQVNTSGAIAAATGITSSGTITFSGLPTGIVHSTGGVLSSSSVNLEGSITEISGKLQVGNGGTGRSSVTSAALLVGNGSSAMNELAVGGANTILGVTAGAPAWVTLTTDATLVGDGRGTAFGLKLNNANTWAALQTFSNGASVSGGLTIPAGTNPMSVNGSNGTADQVLTSQGANSPQWKSISTLGVLTGTGASNKLAYWSGTSTLSNDADLGYDGTTLSMAGATDNISVGQSTNGGTNVRVNMKDGHLRSQQTTAPTTAINANAGTTGSITLSNATDVAGKITINTKGTGMATGTQATITFNAAYNIAPIVVLTPVNAKATTVQAYVSSTTTTFSVSFNVAGGNNDDHEFFYHVIETQ